MEYSCVKKSYGKCMCFLIYLSYTENEAKSLKWGKPGKLVPILIP